MRLPSQSSSTALPSTSGRCSLHITTAHARRVHIARAGGEQASEDIAKIPIYLQVAGLAVVTLVSLQAQYHRAPQLKATEVLSKLLQSEDPKVAARENIDSLTEEFFMMSSTYLEMVRTCLG